MKPLAKKVVIALGLGAVIYFTLGYFSLVHLSTQLASDLSSSYRKVSNISDELTLQIGRNHVLEGEKAQLKDELVLTKEEVRRSQTELDRLAADMEIMKFDIGELKNKNDILRRGVRKLLALKANLESRVDRLSRQKGDLESRFRSLAELQKAINHLKVNPGEQQEYRQFNEEMAQGNQGYLLRDGTPTFKPEIEVKVLPAP